MLRQVSIQTKLRRNSRHVKLCNRVNYWAIKLQRVTEDKSVKSLSLRLKLRSVT